MKRIMILALVLLSMLGTFLAVTTGSWAESGRIIYVIPVSGEITPAMAAFFKNGIIEAEELGADAILIEISTLGGRVDAAFDIKRTIEESEVPVIVYIGDRALSAGALISISAPRIIMAPGSHIGSAEPIPYSIKAVAAIRGEFEATAERTGRDKSIAAAMVDKDVVVEGISPSGSLLDITAETAKEYGYAEEVLKGRANVLNYLGFTKATIVEDHPDPIVGLALFLARGNISSLLLTVGIIAIIIEILSQGFGLAGIIGIAALSLYFGANFIVGYSQWWPIMIFALGIILLVIEAFIPGFGIAGISGISAMVIGIVFVAPDPLKGLKNLGIALVLVIISAPVIGHYFNRLGAFKSFILSDTIVDKLSDKDENKEGRLLGSKGIVLTDLRPSGIVDVDNKRIDALSRGEFIETGTPIRVVEDRGLSVIVEEDKNDNI